MFWWGSGKSGSGGGGGGRWKVVVVTSPARCGSEVGRNGGHVGGGNEMEFRWEMEVKYGSKRKGWVKWRVKLEVEAWMEKW